MSGIVNTLNSVVGGAMGVVDTLVSGPKAPPQPPAAPPPPSREDPLVVAAADAERRKRQRAAGRASTVLTGGQGDTSQAQVSAAKLLGG